MIPLKISGIFFIFTALLFQFNGTDGAEPRPEDDEKTENIIL